MLHHGLALAATVLSAGFFVACKLVISRGLDWRDLWAWSLTTTGVCGLFAWLALGAPAVPWPWVVGAGLAGSLAHVCSNQALRWGDASLLVPVSGAKPVVVVALLPLFAGSTLPRELVLACCLATGGIALVGLAPRRTHAHAPRPGAAFLLMGGGMVLMALSDLFGMRLMHETAPGNRLGAIAAWNAMLGLVPGVAMLAWRRPPSLAAIRSSMAIGIVFVAFIATLAGALATAPDPVRGVAEVNVVVAWRGLVAIGMVLALDRWLGTRLEPLPRHIHLLRAAGAAVLVLAVWLAYAGAGSR